MKKTMLILAIAGFVAGCSSEPVKEQPRAEQPRAATEPSRPTQLAPIADLGYKDNSAKSAVFILANDRKR